jgi:hypothetical protein
MQNADLAVGAFSCGFKAGKKAWLVGKKPFG